MARWFLCLIVFFSFSILFSTASVANENTAITAENLFSIMESRTEKIDSITVDVLLENSLASKTVSLSIKSPDKFSIEFDDGSIKTFFNGKDLWIYLAAINEVFYYSATKDNSVLSYLPWINPKRIFTNLTRNTLFSLFILDLIKKEVKVKKTDSSPAVVEYTLKLTPRIESVFKQVFDVGHYYMVFSSENWLPVGVSEFAPNGLLRGTLRVKKYEINHEIDDSFFNFNPPEGTPMIPLSVVFAQKIEEYSAFIVKKFSDAAQKMKSNILNWSF